MSFKLNIGRVRLTLDFTSTVIVSLIVMLRTALHSPLSPLLQAT